MRYLLAAALALTMTCWTACLGQTSGTLTDRAQRKVADAQWALSKAEGDLKVARSKVDRIVQSTPQYIEAAKAKSDAEAKYDAVLKAAAQSLQNSPAYKTALDKKHEAEQKRDAVKHDPSATPEQRLQAATEVLAAASAVSKLERDAGAADPTVAEAKSELAAANAKLAALREVMEDKYKDDKGVQAAKKEMEEAKIVLADAKKELDFRQAQVAIDRNAAPPPKVGMAAPPPPNNTTHIPGNQTAK